MWTTLLGSALDVIKTSPAPRYSVIVAVFNAESTIAAAIESVQAQTFSDFELILVDDGSTDATLSVLQSAAEGDRRIQVVSQTNAGTAAARNAGWARAEGELRVFLDADDMLCDNYLAAQDEFVAAYPGYDIYSCNVSLLLRDGEARPYSISRAHHRVMSLSAEDQIAESSIFLMSVITPEVWRITGGFRDLHSEDYDFWLRALLGGARHIHNPRTLAVYRRAAGSKSTQLVEAAKSLLWIQRDASTRADLTAGQRAALEAALQVSEARVVRRQLEEELLEGRVPPMARRQYMQGRAAYPSRFKYLLGLLVVLLSPGLYGAIKRRRFV